MLTPRLNATAALNAVTVSWPAGLVNFNLQTSTNLADWSSWIHAVVNTNGQSVATDANASFSFFRLSASAPRFPPAPLTYETESLAITTNGATATIVTNAGASGGKYVSFNSAAAGNSVTFVLTNVPAGVYDLELSFRAVANCVKLTLAAAG